MSKLDPKIEPEPRNIHGVIIAESDDWGNATFDVAAITKKVSDIFYTFCVAKQLKNKQVDYSLLLTDDKNIQELNNQFLNKNKPTNVLSFPQYELYSGDLQALASEEATVMLGDIAISWQTFITECDHQNKVPEDHFSHLLLHSLLHLIGYDHEDDQEAEEMVALEVELLKQLNINNPYKAEK